MILRVTDMGISRNRRVSKLKSFRILPFNSLVEHLSFSLPQVEGLVQRVEVPEKKSGYL